MAEQYQIIYADPPWHYAKRKTATSFGGGVTDKYPTMTVEEICNLPIQSIAAEDCHLFLWTTMPYLMEANKVIESWGFKYITMGFTWVKINKDGTPFRGVGNWTKSNAELCLHARRGKVIPRAHKDVGQAILEPRREHSRKPDRVRDDIVRMCGDLPRIELFARTTTDGWNVWGNEIDKY